MTHQFAPFLLRTAAIAVTLAGAHPTLADEPLTPDAAAAFALAHNPAIRAADRGVDGSQADRRLARAGWLPHLDLSEDYARSTNPVFVFASKLGQGRFGPQDFALDSLNSPDPFTNATTRVGLQQSLWDGGRTFAAGRAAKLGVTAAGEELAHTRDEVAFGAKRAFWDAVLADELVSASRDAEKAAVANAELAGRLVDEGIGVPSDRMQADVRLGEVSAMRVGAEQNVLIARAALRRALGAKGTETFTLAAPAIDADDKGTAAEGPGTSLTEALAARPDLLAFDARIGQAHEGETIALSGRLPQFGVGAQYEWNGSEPFRSSGTNWSVAAFLRIPLYDGCEGLARHQRARADRLRLEAMREALADTVDVELQEADARRRTAEARLRSAESNVSLSQEALRIVRERYGEGLAMIVELLGAEASATGARAARAQASRDLAVSRLAVELAAGRPLAARQPANTAKE